MVRVVCEELDPAIVKKVSCDNCAAQLEYVPNDVRSYHGTDISGGPRMLVVDGCGPLLVAAWKDRDGDVHEAWINREIVRRTCG